MEWAIATATYRGKVILDDVLSNRRRYLWHAGTVHNLHDARKTNYSFPHPIVLYVPNIRLMRAGVHLPVQSSDLVNKSRTPPTRGQTKKQLRNPGWLPKFAFAPDRIVDILGLRSSDNSESPLELEDLANTLQNPPGDQGVLSSAARKRDKRLHKLERLAEQEEMKFSHSIQFNAVPDWSNNYIAYSNLKKL
jgi:hypothetical protein